MGLLTAATNYYGVGLSLLSAVCFRLIANLIKLTGLTEPISVRDNAQLAWKWRNFLISFAHSTITGIGAIYCFYKEPKLKDEMISTFTKTAYYLICFSQGYFIYDVVEMIKSKCKGSYEIVAHHLMIMSCFSITLFEYKYLGYCCSALTIELHNIFLHLRQLLHIANVSKRNVVYRLNRIANIATFVTFRILPLIWIANCLIKHYNIVPKRPYYVAVFSFFVIFGMTCVLLYRLIQSDFLNQRNHQYNEAIEQDKSKLTPSKAINGCTSISNGLTEGVAKQD